MKKHYTKKLSNVIEINEAEIQDHLGELVRGTVDETLDSMLDAEADNLCNASRNEHTATMTDTRAGYYERDLETKTGKPRYRIEPQQKDLCTSRRMVYAAYQR